MVGLQLKGRRHHHGKALMKKDMSLPAGAGLPSTHQSNLILSNLFFSSSQTLIPVADVRAADIALATDYEFGSVKSGFLRLFERFNNVTAAERRGFDTAVTLLNLSNRIRSQLCPPRIASMRQQDKLLLDWVVALIFRCKRGKEGH
jgi:hypothetical protein